MRIRQPIFINGFSHGGTNIVLNLLLSHPAVCMASGETHEVFRKCAFGESRWHQVRKRLQYDYPLRIWTRQRLFFENNLATRHVSQGARRFIDFVLDREKLRARHEFHNYWKRPGEPYRQQEVRQARLVTKNMRGIQMMSDVFREMYPDATFIGVVRHPLALCEGSIRRGFTAQRYAREFGVLIRKMVADARQYANYHLIRFEDILDRPHEMLRELYHLVGLDLAALEYVRLQAKATMSPEGRHMLRNASNRQVLWYRLSEFAQHLQKDVNRNQLAVLEPAAREKMLESCGDLLEPLGYSTHA